MSLTLLDWFIVVVMAGGLARGMYVGAVRQVASIAGLIVAFVVSVQLMHPVGEITAQSLGLSEAAVPLVGFVVVFAGVQLIVFGVARMLESALESLHLSLANRAAGGALGAFKAALLMSVLFLVTTQLNVPDEQSQQESTLYGPVASVLPDTWDYAAAYLPKVKRASDAFGRRVRPALERDPFDEPGSSGSTTPASNTRVPSDSTATQVRTGGTESSSP